MRSFLLYRDQDFIPQWGMLLKSPYPTWWREREFDELRKSLPLHKQQLTQDLELEVLFRTMAGDDTFVYEVVKNVILASVIDQDTIRYRQEILRDCIQNREVVRILYQIAVESIEEHAKLGRYSSQSIDSVRRTSLQILDHFIATTKKIRELSHLHGSKFSSEGFRNFFKMIDSEYSDEYTASLQELIGELQFPYGQLMSARLGKGNKGIGYTLHRNQKPQRKGIIDRLFTKENSSQYSFFIADRDYNGFKALAELRAKSMNAVVNTLGQSADTIHNFFSVLKRELAFYIGCLNLEEKLTSIDEPVSFPIPAPSNTRVLTCKGLYDVCLALHMNQKVVGNDVNGNDRDLFIITGANRGGKSTFVRSIGLAQLMMQSGMFVPAKSFSSNMCTGIFTHFKREEDHTMRSGKFDEELSRMNALVDHLRKDSLIIFNESFAATNEREGSEISLQIVSALLDNHIKVFFVTHLYEFSKGMYDKNMANALFLRAERLPGGDRTYQIKEGKPLRTSYAEDLYVRVFDETPRPFHQSEPVEFV